MAQFYFAWATSGDTVFSESAHAVNDEDVLSFELAQSEGEFATLRVEIRNPRAGLLSASRSKWVWFSWDQGESYGVEPLFFGRIVGVPESLSEEIIRLEFRARPLDYDIQRAALADSLKVFPLFDPVWINPEIRDEPDSALEARPALWHVNRVTHVLTASDIVTGGGTTFTVTDHFYDSLNVSFRQRPANKVKCRAEVRWQNEATGEVDISAKLRQAFVAAGSSRGANYITSYTGEGLERTWPEEDKSIGAGWRVGAGSLVRVDSGEVKQEIYNISVSEPIYAAFPLWTFRTTFNARYEVSRSYTERVVFEFNADVQPLIADADDEDTIEINLSSSAIGEAIDEDGSTFITPLRDRRFRSYFLTDRGKQSLEYLICLCRARMLARARAVEISFEVPFADVQDISCDDNVVIYDDRLPGGQAAGKVVGYQLSLNGDDGQLGAVVSIACTIGRGGSVFSTSGEPVYAAGWANNYQAIVGGATAISSDVSYTSYDTATVNDDGVDLSALTADNIIESLAIVGGQAAQEAVLSSKTFADVSEAIDALNEVHTQVALSLVPLTGGPFETEIPVTVSDLIIPQTIDLEAEGSA